MLFTFVLSFIALVAASPTLSPRANGHFVPIYERESKLVRNGEVNVTYLRSKLIQTQSKYDRNFQSYERNIRKRHSLDHRDTAGHIMNKRASHVESIETLDGSSFFQTSRIGSPEQTVILDLDTGSSDLIVPGAGCSNCGAHNPYYPKRSYTSRATGIGFTSNFGASSATASCTGVVYYDTVQFGTLTVASQALGATSSEAASYSKNWWDGILGLAYPALTSYGAAGSSPLMLSLAAQGILDQKRFGFMFMNNVGIYIGADPAKTIIGPIHWVKVQKPLAFWEIPLTSVGFNSTKPVTDVNAIIDTGATGVFGDKASVQALYSHVKGAKDASSTIAPGYYTFPCTSGIALNFTFGDTKFLMFADSAGFIQGYVPGSTTECIGSIAYHSASYWILGLAFLRNVYTSFDMSGHQVGFAQILAFKGYNPLPTD